MNIQDLVDQEIEQRDEVRKLIMSHVQTLCEVGKGWVKRGVLNQYVYQALGFHGRYGNHFGIYMQKLMAQEGFRVSYRTGQRVFYGLHLKEPICQNDHTPKTSASTIKPTDKNTSIDIKPTTK